MRFYKVIFLLSFMVSFLCASCYPSTNSEDHFGENTETELDHEVRAQGNLAQYRFSGTLSEWSERLNDQGFRFYQKQDYEEAIKYFRMAILADASFILSHYNLACMLALQYRQEKRVDLQEIFDELNISLLLDPTRARRPANWIYSRLKDDSDLDSVRDRIEFKALFNLDTKKEYKNPQELLLGSWANNDFAWIFKKNNVFEYNTASGWSRSDIDIRRYGKWELDEKSRTIKLSYYPEGVEIKDMIIAIDEEKSSSQESPYIRGPLPKEAVFDLKQKQLRIIVKGVEYQYFQTDCTALKNSALKADYIKTVYLLKQGFKIHVWSIQSKIRPAMHQFIKGWQNMERRFFADDLENRSDPKTFLNFINKTRGSRIT